MTLQLAGSGHRQLEEALLNAHPAPRAPLGLLLTTPAQGGTARRSLQLSWPATDSLCHGSGGGGKGKDAFLQKIHGLRMVHRDFRLI